MELAEQYDAKKVERKWQELWEKEKLFRFDAKSKKPVFSIDTPPPTVSGNMHMGHAFSYSQMDFIVRYKRMRGFNLFYPFGTDDNGLATERLIEKVKNVRARNMKRDEFAKLCLDTLIPIRKDYLRDFKSIGLSCDWDIFYTTINEHCRKISQKSFIDLYKMGREYRKEAPVIWCPECGTAIAQVELEDKEMKSYFNDVIFRINGKDVVISTTRPELLPACVAVFVNPADKRHKNLVGKKAKVPLFGYEVPVLSDERVDVEKGTGVVMCCTFGDMVDAEWYKQYKLPLRVAITKTGEMTDVAGKYKGMKLKEARGAIIEDLKSKKLLAGQKEVTHVVNAHERCGTEIEILETKQWFIRYLDLKDEFMNYGKKLKWYPSHMFNRYENWIKGLQWDWCISRQRFFGVPFPVWYCRKCDEVILADEKQLPVDPLASKPLIKKCPKCGSTEFIPEKDVLDTWATSSLSPRLAIEQFPNMSDKLYPMSLRAQAHDIITFWLFNTVVKSYLHFRKIPWKDVMISGWALDPKGKKMSKSRGNVIEPRVMIDKYSADCLRFWAASTKLGEDAPFQEKELVSGKKFSVKLWNASRFVFMHLKDYAGKPKKLEVFDRWILTKLMDIIKDSTDNFERYEYSKTKADVENFFWHVFCDYYLEIIKDRLYNADKRGKDSRKAAQFTLYTVLLDILKLMAPIMPYITEEIHSAYFSEKTKSIHLSEWPAVRKELVDKKAEQAGDIAAAVISEVRKFKAGKNMSLKEELKKLVIKIKDKKLLEGLLDDLKATVHAKEISFEGKADIDCGSEIKIGIEI